MGVRRGNAAPQTVMGVEVRRLVRDVSTTSRTWDRPGRRTAEEWGVLAEALRGAAATAERLAAVADDRAGSSTV
jgi:hypothetical protein